MEKYWKGGFLTKGKFTPMLSSVHLAKILEIIMYCVSTLVMRESGAT